MKLIITYDLWRPDNGIDTKISPSEHYQYRSKALELITERLNAHQWSGVISSDDKSLPFKGWYEVEAK